MKGSCLGSFGYFTFLYSKLIGWEIEGREYAVSGGDQSSVVLVP
jgi:hypothetical protein